MEISGNNRSNGRLMAWLWHIALVTVLCWLPSLVSAQPPIFTSGIDIVHIGVTVLDQDGRPVTDLTVADFEVLEDGRPQEVRYFARGLASDAETMPLHLGLLLDVSRSMERDDRFQKSAAIKFLNAVTYAVDTTVVDFDTEVRVGRYGQDDFLRLIERIRGRQPEGATALYDALGVYLDGAFEQEGRKVLIVYTDGEDTRSRQTFGDTRDLLRASDVTVYAIGLHTNLRASARQRQRMLLAQLTDSTGGRSYFPDSLDDLDRIYEEIEAELNARYSIGFVFTNTESDGTWRELRIRLRSDRDDLRGTDVRTRDGYFAAYREPAGPDR